MELKKYQKETLEDLEQYISVLNENKGGNLTKTYEEYWLEKGVNICSLEITYLHTYVNSVPHTPRVTLKVPTAGGKTFIACNAIKTIIDNLQTGYQNKVVAWFVPSDTILKQTLRNLQDVSHPYRQRLDSMFNNRVTVIDKESALVGQGLSPANLLSNLVILVLSAQSFIENDKAKVGNAESSKPKAFRQNGNFIEHANLYKNSNNIIDGTDPTALIQVIAQQNPIVVVDESHNFMPDLRVELLNNLSPRFILELTATPRENSNIISFVDAMKLKKENMVKLPIIVENRKSTKDVLISAIRMRNSLEKHAEQMEKNGGKYIRPIVLFQAQPRTNEDNVTFDKIKASLVNSGIPEEQIKIKIAEKDELKGVNLMSKDCPVRYIITVNALKEGWDCPFAYILATLANKTSDVDVEQILGRILRQPYTVQHSNDLLNLSYVFTSSMNFRQTVDKIIMSLEKTGFSRKEFREVKGEEEAEEPATQTTGGQDLFGNPSVPETVEDKDDIIITQEEAEEIKKKTEPTSSNNKEIEKLQEEAVKINEEYNKQVEESLNNNDANPLAAITPMENKVKINSSYLDVALSMQLPMFFKKTKAAGLFSNEEWIPLEKEMLTEGLELETKDASINFVFSQGQGVAIDIEQSEDDYVPRLKNDSEAFALIRQQYLDLDAKGKKKSLAKDIAHNIKLDYIPEPSLRKYVSKAIENLDSDKVMELLDNIDETTELIKKKIKNIVKEHSEKVFYQWIDTDKVIVKDHYKFDEKVAFNKQELKAISKGLYLKEETVNNFEYEVIKAIAQKSNVLFWHRNPERTGFHINGFINHYPDFIVRTKKGNTILVETKGPQLTNDDSRDKIRLGRKWADLAGQTYKYFMVFDDVKVEGAINVQEFLKNIDEL